MIEVERVKQMSVEEAIEVLAQDLPCETDEDLSEAMTMAIKALETVSCIKEKCAYCPHCENCDVDDETLEIKALEQQPCEDAVSRYDALNCVTFNEVRYRMVEDIKALPSVTPKSKSESEHDHEVVKAYNDGQAYILDKIRAEIEDIPNNPITKPVGTYDYVMGATNERRIILEIINKYRGE